MWKWSDMPSSEELRSRQGSNRESPGSNVNRSHFGGHSRKSRHNAASGQRKHKSHKTHKKKHVKQPKEFEIPISKPLVEYDDVSSNSSFYTEQSEEKQSSPDLRENKFEKRRTNKQDVSSKPHKKRTKDRHQSEKKDRNKEKLPPNVIGSSSSHSKKREKHEKDFLYKDRASSSKESGYVSQMRIDHVQDFDRNKDRNRFSKKRGRTPETPRAYRARTPSPVKDTQTWVNKARRKSQGNRYNKYVSKSPSPFQRNFSAWSRSRSKSPVG